MGKVQLCFDELFNTFLGRFMNGRKHISFNIVHGGTEENVNIITACVILFNPFYNHGT